MDFIVLFSHSATLHESPRAMANASCTPVITVTQDVYDAILLAERVMVVAAGRPKLSRVVGAALPDFFNLRQSFLSAPYEAPDALLRLMVGG